MICLSVCPWSKLNFSLFGQIMTMYDNLWQLLTASNSFWQPLTASDSFWQLMTTYDNLWQLLWHLLTPFDNFWQLLTTYTCSLCKLSSSQDLVVGLVIFKFFRCVWIYFILYPIEDNFFLLFEFDRWNWQHCLHTKLTPTLNDIRSIIKKISLTISVHTNNKIDIIINYYLQNVHNY